MGPKSRELLSAVSPNDFSNAAHPFGTAREIEIGMGLARAHRVTYVGELGWELYVSTDQAAHVFEALEAADRGMVLCGLHTLDSCRIEKAYRHFGHDITDEDHVLEAGLGFAVKPAKGDSSGARRCCASRRRGWTAGWCSSA
jgi:glycine cleavage system aminomethyltransferase T